MPPVHRQLAPRSTFVGSSTVGLPVSSSASETLRKRIQADPLILKALRLTVSIKLNPKLTEELSRFCITARDLARPGHYEYRVNTQFLNPRKDVIAIAEASLRIQAYRDRVCEVQLELIGLKGKLQRLYRGGDDVIRERYGTEIAALGLRAESSVQQFVGKVLDPMNVRLMIIAEQLAQVEATLKNLDQSHYTYRDVGTLAEKILSRAEGGYGVTRQPLPGA